MNKTYPGLYISSKSSGEVVEEIIKSTLPEKWDRTVFKPETGFGLLYRPPTKGNLRENFIYDGIEMEFVDFWPTDSKGKVANYIRAAYTKIDSSSYLLTTILIPISSIKLNTLKSMELWKYLSEDLKQKLEANSLINPVVDQEKEDTPIVGRKRNPEYANLPRELKCTSDGCEGKSGYISPTMLVKLAEARELSPEDYIKTWKCSKCVPRKRGKQVSAKWATYPKDITCSKCGSKHKQHPSMSLKFAEAKGLSFEEYTASWLCKECKGESTTTTTTRGRKCTPDSPWYGKSKELKCSCGKVQPQHPSITTKQAEKLGISFDEFVNNWKCRDCRPKKSFPVRKSVG